jgi:hypothetical protein
MKTYQPRSPKLPRGSNSFFTRMLDARNSALEPNENPDVTRNSLPRAWDIHHTMRCKRSSDEPTEPVAHFFLVNELGHDSHAFVVHEHNACRRNRDTHEDRTTLLLKPQQSCCAPSMNWTPAAAQAAKISLTSSALHATGFSHRTCLPFCAHLILHSLCMAVGSGMYLQGTGGTHHHHVDATRIRR